MEKTAEQKFDKGYFVIRVSDGASAREISDWHANGPKEYQVRVVNPDGDKMKNAIHLYTRQTWNDLDGQHSSF